MNVFIDRDWNKSVDMIAARRREREYFNSSHDYSHLQSKMGSEYLGKVLSKHLEAVIRARIPSIAAMINKTTDDIEAELNQIGRPLANDAGKRRWHQSSLRQRVRAQILCQILCP